jgi:hypothetical protein
MVGERVNKGHGGREAELRIKEEVSPASGGVQ